MMIGTGVQRVFSKDFNVYEGKREKEKIFRADWDDIPTSLGKLGLGARFDATNKNHGSERGTFP